MRYNLNCQPGSPLDEAKQEYRNAIIEECARVAEEFITTGAYAPDEYATKDIAKAIRALRDKP